MHTKRWRSIIMVLAILSLFPLGLTSAQGPVGLDFTYQGYLTGDNLPIDGTCDFQFTLWNDPAAGSQVGPLVERPAVPVGQGRFTTRLDFGSAYDGTALWLQVAVRCGDPAYTTLAPRQALTAAPYAAATLSLRGQPLSGAAPAAGQVLEWDGTSWTAAVDDDTTYSAGAGLVLLGTTFAADEAYLQRRVAPCGAGYAIQAVNQDGSVVCALVDNTTYTAGVGLVLSGTVFYADEAYLQRRVAPCGAGYAIQAVNQDGSVVCALVDNTTYTAGVGLDLIGTEFSLLAAYRLPQTCALNEIPKWDGAAWACAADDDTTYTAGTGLALVGNEFSLLAAYRLPQTCALNEIPKWNGAAWACAADDNTTYTAGTGLALVGNEFSLLAAYRLPQTCALNEILKWDGAAWACAADDNTTYTAGTGLALVGNEFSLLAAYRLPQTCALNEIPKWNGAAWACAADDNTTYSSDVGLDLIGTVFSIALTYRLPQTCIPGQGAEWDGATWVCATYSASDHDHWGDNWGGSGVGLTLNSSDAIGLSGSGASIGVQGMVTSATGAGVYGAAAATAAYGVQAMNAAGTAVYGENAGGSYPAVHGRATATTVETYGVRGEAVSTIGRGVHGWATAAAGTTYGVFGQTDSIAGRGVHGLATAAAGTTYGVFGRTDSTDGRGVYGWATAATGTTYGVYGRADSTDGYAGWFEGNVWVIGDLEITGNLSKGGGGWRIDDPRDPANAYLYHSFVESPDMKNFYDGVVTLGADGAAWVELPAWFELLNKDLRYQLTPIGGAAPGLYIAREVEGNRFQIAGGPAGLKVSWLVTGIRADPWAEAHRIQVEVAKPAGEKGTYLHPELYGQPPEKGLGYQPGPEAPPETARPAAWPVEQP